MKIRNKNPAGKELIGSLLEMGLKTPAWKAVAKGLNRPKRKAYEISVSKIEKYAKKGENVVVPGTVLSDGEISKSLTIAALHFTASAKEKIEAAGGKCISIEDIMKENPSAKKVRIMG